MLLNERLFIKQISNSRKSIVFIILLLHIIIRVCKVFAIYEIPKNVSVSYQLGILSVGTFIVRCE